jgi:hypothetical protein
MVKKHRRFEEDWDGDIARDGESVNVPSLLMDGRRVIRGDARPEAQAVLRALADAQSQRRGMADAAAAWAGHRPSFAMPTADQIRRRNEAYNSYVTRITNAWKMDARRVKPDPDEDNNGNGDYPDNGEFEDERSRYIFNLTNAMLFAAPRRW